MLKNRYRKRHESMLLYRQNANKYWWPNSQYAWQFRAWLLPQPRAIQIAHALHPLLKCAVVDAQALFWVLVACFYVTNSLKVKFILNNVNLTLLSINVNVVLMKIT